MPLNIRHTDQDEAPLLDGDDRFLKVVMRGHPALLAEGIVPFAKNYRFREGILDPRGGTVKPAWLNQISGTNLSAWNSTQGRGHYVDALKRQWTLLAVNGAVRAILPHNAPRTVPLPAGVTLAGGEQFLQTGNTVLLLRGAGATPGNTLQMTDLTAGFTAVPAPVVAGLEAIPQAIRGVVAGGRTWLVTIDNEVWASDILDHTSYHPLNQFKVGDRADEIVTLALFGQTSLIVFLKKSVYRLTNILNPDVLGLLANTTAPRITERYGCLAPDSVVDVGTDLLWLCQEGVASLTLTTEGEVQGGEGPTRPPMFSDDIQPLIARIRWDSASGAQGAFWDGRLYMAVPLDEAESVQVELLSGVHHNPVSIATTAGHHYRYVPGANEVSLNNGADTITTAQDFVAAGTSVLLIGTGNLLPITASLKRVFKGVNNAILVYDFKALAPGWQGYDEAEGLLFPKYFFRRAYNGRDRLFFLNGDGWGTLYEEGPEDALAQPYTDLTLVSALSGGAGSFNVNGGTTVAFTFGSGINSAGAWGLAGSLASDRQNLFGDIDGLGYQDGLWTHPNCDVVQITNGVRFYANNGQRPTVNFTIPGADVAALIAVSTSWQSIRTELLSRGYKTPAVLERKSARKLQAIVETWGPTYSIALKSEGVNEEVSFVSGRTRSRTRYHRPFNRQAWVASNASNDFATAGREDYSLTLATAFKLGAGLGVQLHQEAEHSLNVKGRARAHQIRITNTTGRLRLLGLGYEGRRRERGHGVKI